MRNLFFQHYLLILLDITVSRVVAQFLRFREAGNGLLFLFEFAVGNTFDLVDVSQVVVHLQEFLAIFNTLLVEPCAEQYDGLFDLQTQVVRGAENGRLDVVERLLIHARAKFSLLSEIIKLSAEVGWADRVFVDVVVVDSLAQFIDAVVALAAFQEELCRCLVVRFLALGDGAVNQSDDL